MSEEERDDITSASTSLWEQATTIADLRHKITTLSATNAELEHILKDVGESAGGLDGITRVQSMQLRQIREKLAARRTAVDEREDSGLSSERPIESLASALRDAEFEELSANLAMELDATENESSEWASSSVLENSEDVNLRRSPTSAGSANDGAANQQPWGSDSPDHSSSSLYSLLNSTDSEVNGMHRKSEQAFGTRETSTHSDNVPWKQETATAPAFSAQGFAPTSSSPERSPLPCKSRLEEQSDACPCDCYRASSLANPENEPWWHDTSPLGTRAAFDLLTGAKPPRVKASQLSNFRRANWKIVAGDSP